MPPCCGGCVDAHCAATQHTGDPQAPAIKSLQPPTHSVMMQRMPCRTYNRPPLPFNHFSLLRPLNRRRSPLHLHLRLRLPLPLRLLLLSRPPVGHLLAGCGAQTLVLPGVLLRMFGATQPQLPRHVRLSRGCPRSQPPCLSFATTARSTCSARCSR